MQLTVEGKQLDIGDALRQYVEDQLTDAAKKYFANPIEATVVLAKETSLLFSADISIHVGKNILLQAHHEANDPYAAFDVAVSRLTKRMRRYKDKLRSYHKRAAQEEGQGVLARSYTLSGSDDEDIGPESGDEPVIVAEMATTIQSLTPSDAVMRVDLMDVPALLFHNSSHGGLNLVYRRKDGNIGWIDPEGNEKTVADKKKAG